MLPRSLWFVVGHLLSLSGLPSFHLSVNNSLRPKGKPYLLLGVVLICWWGSIMVRPTILVLRVLISTLNSVCDLKNSPSRVITHNIYQKGCKIPATVLRLQHFILILTLRWKVDSAAGPSNVQVCVVHDAFWARKTYGLEVQNQNICWFYSS